MDWSKFNVAEYLKHLPLFSVLKEEERRRLAQQCRLRPFGRGELLFREGEPCTAFHVVVAGQVKLFALSPAGHEKTIEIIGPGGTFGEALMFMGHPYIVDVQALTDGVLIEVPRQAVLNGFAQDPEFCMRMLAGLSRRLHALVQDIQALTLHSGVERVIGYLLRDLPTESSGQGPLCVELSATKATIASRLSMTPEYFSRVLRELERAGLVEVVGRKIRILDVQALVTYRPPR